MRGLAYCHYAVAGVLAVLAFNAPTFGVFVLVWGAAIWQLGIGMNFMGQAQGVR